MNLRNVTIVFSILIALTIVTVAALAYKGHERVAALELAAPTHITEAQAKAVIATELAPTGQIGTALTALHATVTAERDTAIQQALVPVNGKLKAVASATTAIELAAADAKEVGLQAQRSVYGKERGLAQAVTVLAERVNARETLSAVADPTDSAAVEAAKREAEAAIRARAELPAWTRMLAATAGQSAEEVKAKKGAAIEQAVTIVVHGETVTINGRPATSVAAAH